MQFRFTLSNVIEGSQVISNPDGWQDIKVKLERDPKFHSLVEKIEVPLIFYRSNGDVDGGYDYIKNIELTQGINAIIVILIEISEDEGTTFETFFEGNLDLSDIEEFSEGDSFYTLKCPILQTSLWSKFFNRIETPVDLQSVNDLDGNLTQVISPIEVNLIGQVIDQNFSGQLSPGRSVLVYPDGDIDTTTDKYIQLDFGDIVDLDEIKERFSIPISSTADPAPIFSASFAGDYEFNIRVELSFSVESANILNSCIPSIGTSYTSGSEPSGDLAVYIRINNGTPVALSELDYLNGTTGRKSTIYTYTGTQSLSVNDQVFIYAEAITLASDSGVNVLNIIVWGNDNSTVDLYRGNFSAGMIECEVDDIYFTNYNFGVSPSGDETPTTLSLTAKTTYPDTTTDALLIHDVFKAIVNRTTGQFPSFYSERLGRITHGYEQDGCNSAYANMLGLHVRGYSFDDKPFFQSFKDAWDGADPIFNLGVGYEDVAAVDEGYEFNFDFNLDFNS